MAHFRGKSIGDQALRPRKGWIGAKSRLSEETRAGSFPKLGCCQPSATPRATHGCASARTPSGGCVQGKRPVEPLVVEGTARRTGQSWIPNCSESNARNPVYKLPT